MPRELSHCAIPEPITPAPMTAACATFSPGALDGPFLYLSARKKLRIRLRVDSVSPSSTMASSSRASESSIELVRLRLMISAARAGAGFCERGACDWRCWTCGSTSLRRDSLPRVQFLARGFEQLVLRNDFVDQAKLQRFAARNEVSLSRSLPPAFSGPISRGKRVAPPQAGTRPSVVSGNPMRVAGASDATR